MHDDEEYLFRVLQAGASGYILKSAPDMDLISAIRTVHQGSAYLYPSATKMLIQDFLHRVQKGDCGTAYPVRKTVETHKTRVMEKLHLKTRPELVRYAIKKGLLEFE